MHFDIISSLLACPSCHDAGHTSTVVSQGKVLSCSTCKLEFPTAGGLLWFFFSPQAAFFEWKSRYSFFLQAIAQDVEEMKLATRDLSLLPHTQKRLQRMIQAKQEHVKEVKKILEPLAVSETGSIERSMALKVRQPETQQLMSYYHNVLRDWGWGEAENAAAFAVLKKALDAGAPDAEGKKSHTLGVTAVLGAGAGRLAVDCHNYLSPSQTIAVDINPFLSLCLKRIVEGRALNLYEFPMAPVDQENFAVRVRCEAKQPTKEHFYIVLADAMNPPFNKGSIQTLITPWLIDIVPQDSRAFFKRLNHALPIGGRWINFGSLAYNHKQAHVCYSREEVLELAKEAGFAIESVHEEEIPYLQSPHSSQKRFEKIFCFSAKKIANVTQSPSYTYLPMWIRDLTKPIPAMKDFGQMVAVNRFFADIVALVNGTNSIVDIAKTFAKSAHLNGDEAQEMVRQLFINMFEAQQRKTF